MKDQESWDEQSEVLRATLSASVDLSEEVRRGAEQFLEWSLWRSRTRTRLRRDEAVKKARDLVLAPSLKVAPNALMETIQRALKDPSGRFLLAKEIEDELRLLCLNDQRLRELQQLSDLLFELAEFCFILHPSRVTKNGQRTRDPATGQRYCSVCFRPSQRYALQYTHPSTYGSLLFRSSFARDFCSADGDRPSREYCTERHSTSGKKLRSQNRGKLATDNSEEIRLLVRIERNGYERMLEELGLERPLSNRLHRIAVWYRARPTIAKRELPARIEMLKSRRPRAKKLIDYVLSALPSYNPNALTLDDSTMMIQIYMEGYFHIIDHSGALLPSPYAPWEASSFERAYPEMRRRLVEITHPEFDRGATLDTASFEELGIEISTSKGAFIRFVFESPKWLSAVCGLAER